MVFLVSAEDIFSRLSEEKKTGDLLPLPEDLYSKIEANRLPDKTQEENRQRLVATLRARRTQKILTYIAYGRKLPKPVPDEEEKLYIRIKKTIEEDGATPASPKIKILVSAPELMTPEGRKVGPFEKNTIVEIGNRQDLEFLLKNKIGEAISQ